MHNIITRWLLALIATVIIDIQAFYNTIVYYSGMLRGKGELLGPFYQPLGHSNFSKNILQLCCVRGPAHLCNSGA